MPEPGSPAGDLARLIETERRSEALLAEARSEAAEIVRIANEAARSEEAMAARDIEQAARDLRSRLAAARQREECAIVAEGRRLAQRYDEVPERVIERLADHVVNRLIGERLA